MQKSHRISASGVAIALRLDSLGARPCPDDTGRSRQTPDRWRPLRGSRDEGRTRTGLAAQGAGWNETALRHRERSPMPAHRTVRPPQSESPSAPAAAESPVPEDLLT